MLMRLRRDERGIALISALLISMVLVAIAVSVVALSIHNSEQSANDRKRIQAVNTAEAGLAATESLLQTTTTTALPCVGTSGSVRGTLPTTPSSEYTATIQYYRSYPPTGSPMPCDGAGSVHEATVLPAAAQISSSGTAVLSGQRGAVTRTMETLVRLRPIRAGFQQAIFADRDLTLFNNLNVNGNVGNDGDVYSNGSFACNNSSNIKGSLLIQGSITLGNTCTVAQDAWAKTWISMTQQAAVGHDATASTASSDITMANSSRVTHNATAGRDCNGCAGRVGGAITPGHVSTSPPRLDFPKVNYVQSCWADPDSCGTDIPMAPYTNFVTFNNCSTSGAGNTQDTIDAGWTDRTVAVISPNCILPWQNNTTVNVRNNLAIVAYGGLQTLNQTIFQGVGGSYDLYLIVPWEATTGGNMTGGTPNCTGGAHDISIANNTNFVNLHVLVYSPCTVSYNNNNSGLGGQVLGGEVDINNLYNLSFFPLRIPGAGQVVGYRVDIAYEREIVNPTP
jgi:hypothetical protein